MLAMRGAAPAGGSPLGTPVAFAACRPEPVGLRAGTALDLDVLAVGAAEGAGPGAAAGPVAATRAAELAAQRAAATGVRVSARL